jgi:hypothetical protein
VRGDSIRDLYAKGLALVGLSLIAGVGALVDRWPLGDVPPVAAVLDQPQMARALPVPALTIRTPDVAPPTLLPLAPSATPVRRAPAVARAVRIDPPPLPASAPIMTLAMARPSILTVQTRLVPPPAAPALTPSPVTVAPATPLALSTPSLFEADALHFAAAVSENSDDGDGDNFFVGAFKKTGSSLVKGGVKTGASIAGAARALGGAFKRVWIFKS